MKEVFEALLQAIHEKKDTMLVTIINSHGSTPRKRGARMLIDQNGHVAGTIGGGTVEYLSEQKAKEYLLQHVSKTESFLLTPKQAAGIGMVCGGKQEVLFQYLPYDLDHLKELCEKVLYALKKNELFYLWSSLNDFSAFPLSFYSETEGTFPTHHFFAVEKTGIYEKEDDTYFVEKAIQTGKVYIFGGGHVAQALVPILHYLDFYTIVVDDRKEFVTKENFPDADELYAFKMEELNDKFTITKNDYALSMTRGHLLDLEVIKRLLHTPAAYLGCMGSKHKIAVQIKNLKELGFKKEDIERISMPIGLDIAAESPQEIGISIAGEMIQKRASLR